MSRISVVTPFLDAALTLQQTVASVLAQTFADWELLLVDDGSRDSSLAIAESAAGSDSRIRVIAAPASGPLGAAAARNRGIAAARSDLIAFLDSDDLFEPEKLAVDVDVLDARPEAAMVYGPTLWWRDGPKPWQWIEPMDREAGRLHYPPTLVTKVILRNDWHVPCTCAVTVRKEAALAVGCFEEQFRLYEDQSLWAKLFLAYPVFVQGRCLARYRQHGKSVSAAAVASGDYSRTERHPARKVFLDWLAGHIDQEGLEDPRLKSALRLARAPYGGTGLQHFLDLLRIAARRGLARARGRVRKLIGLAGSVGRPP